MTNKSRRTFVIHILGALTTGLMLPLFGANDGSQIPTPQEIEGPFYPVILQKDKDFDLTQFDSSKGIAQGTLIVIVGRVLDTQGKPVENALVDLWQANAAGRYRHPRDSNKAPLDPNFQGWAIVPSGKNGEFKFKTIFPGVYPAGKDWRRPPHLHFNVKKQGYKSLTTQMYFPGHELNGKDLLLADKSKGEQAMMIATQNATKPNEYQFNIVLRPEL